MAIHLPRLWQATLLLATRFDSIRNLLLIAFTIFHVAGYAATKTSTKNGNWSDPTVWSPAGVPAITDLVVIKGGHTVTVNGAYTCADLQVGNAVASNTTLRITASGNSLTINGALSINPNNNNNTYTLDAGPGIINVAGTFPTWSTTGTNRIRIGTGAINFTPVVSIVTATQSITFTAAGSASFYGGLTDNVGKLVTFSGCTVNFYHHYTVASTRMNWNSKGTAVFKGNATLTNTASLLFNAVTIDSAASLNMVSGSDSLIIRGALLLANGSTFTANRSFELSSNWTNNGGVFNTGSNTVIFNGTAQTIGGTSGTSFNILQLGTTASTVACTVNRNVVAASVVVNANTKARTVTLASGVAFDVSGNVTINQATADNITNSFSVGAGTLNIAGDLIFAGTSSSNGRKVQVATTSGSFNLAGNVIWLGNTSSATEIISTATGTLNFANSLAMGSGSGTVKVTGAGAINFNGTSAPSLAFGGSTAPVFTTASGSTIKFKTGLTATTTALTFAVGSIVQFSGTATVTPSAAITLGNLVIDSNVTLTTAGNLVIKNNWTNNGGTFVPSTYTVTFNGSGTQTISRVGGETFYKLSLSTANAILSALNNLSVTNTLTMGGHNINLNGNTLILGNNAAATLSRSKGIVYGGTFKRWFPASAITSTNGAYYGLFPIGTATAYRPVAINTTASPTTAGYVSAISSDGTTITQVAYTDNEGASIQTISNMRAVLSTSGLAGGTYKLDVNFTGLGSTGSVSDLKLLTYTSNTMGSFGTTAATTGTVAAPTVKRTALTAIQLNNSFVVGTKNAVNTPIRQFYYSRQNGNWNDAATTWSYNDGGASCNCVPTSDAYVVINTGHTVTINTPTTTDYIEIRNNACLNDNGTAGLTVNSNIVTQGNGKFATTAAWSIAGNVTLSASSITNIGASLSVAGTLTMISGSTLNMQAGTLTLNGDASFNGTMNLTGGALALNSVGGNISGTGSILGNGETVNVTNAKTIMPGANITMGSPVGNVHLAIGSGYSVTNNATLVIYGNLTGGSATSTLVNGPNAILKVSGELLSTGVLNTSTGANKVTYIGANQTVKVPNGSYYILEVSGSGTKTLTSAIDVENNLVIARGGTLNAGTIALSGLGGLSMDENSELILQRSVSGTYPELQGAYNLSYGTVTVNQTAGITTLAPASYYHVKLTGNSSCDLSNVVDIKGDLLIQGGASVTGNGVLDIDGILNFNSTAVSELSNDITVGGISIVSGGLNDGARTITLKGGNWVNNGGTCVLTGSVVFNGNAAQTISGSQATSFYNLAIDNAAGLTLNLSPAAPTVIKNNLLLDSGVIYTSASNVLKLTDTTTSSSGNAYSYIDGPMLKVGNSDFVFPIGKAGKWRRAGVSGMQQDATEVTAEYFATSYSDVETMGEGLSVVSTTEYWDIHRSVTNDSLKLTLYWENADGSTIHACENLTIAHYKGGAWQQEDAVVDSGSICYGIGKGSITTAGYISSFSPFGFGDNGNGNALPVELLSFSAQVAGEDVKVEWATALEINNSHFDVERSVDGVSFEKVATVEGAGNSTTAISYSLFDEQPVFGISYYRLKQVDYDGAFEYSNIVSVNIAGPSATVNVYPNPARGQVNVTAVNAQGSLEVTIHNQTGVEVHKQQLNVNGNTGRLSINTEELPVGMYFVTVKGGNTNTTQKLIIE